MSDQIQVQGHIVPGMNEREQVEQTADRLRDQLLVTLQELERRRERVRAVGPQVWEGLARNRRVVVGVAVGAVALAGLGVVLARWRSRSRASHLWDRRRQAFGLLWAHPEKLLQTERPLPVQFGQRFLRALASSLASASAQQVSRALVSARKASA